MHRSLVTLITLALSSSLVFTQQQSTLTSARDNTLYQTNDGSLSDGSGDYLFVGRVGQTGGGAIRRALVRFDLTGIPSSATILSGVLTMNMSKTTAGGESVALRRMTADWGEGTSNANANEGSGAPSAPNDATWIHRFYPSTLWTTPGGDFSSETSATAQVSSPGTYSWGPASQLTADVQGWLANPGTNFGWILIGNEAASGTAKRFDSGDNSSAANRPKLTVTYALAADVPHNGALPAATSLEQNFPNPFNPTTIIRYTVGSERLVRISVVDQLGREVQLLDQALRKPGTYSVNFNAAGLPSGVYYARLWDGERALVRPMTLMK